MGRRLIVVLTTLTVLSWGVRPAQATIQEEAYQHLEQGNAYHKAGKYKKSVIEYKAAWEKGKIMDACFNLALTYDRDLNENQLAVKYYNEFLAMDSLVPGADDVRELESKARLDIKRTAWWLDKQNKEQTKQDHGVLLEAVKKYGEADALEQHKSRQEDSHRGVSHVCLGCHAGFMGPQVDMASTHPVDRIPTGVLGKTVPKHVRFYKEGRVSCLSCHNPENLHFEIGTPGINYKYLRVDTDRGEDMPRFCAFCHSSKSADRFLGDKDAEEGLSRGGGLEIRR